MTDSPLTVSEFGGVSLTELAMTFRTPLYVYSKEKIEEQYQRLSRALADVKSLICYAVKANSNLSVLKVVKEVGAGFDIVSEGEFRKIIHIEGDPGKVVFSGVAKVAEEIEYALTTGVKLINFESISELKMIAEVAKRIDIRAPVGFRVNPDIALDIHPYLVTGISESKFGMPPEELRAAWEIASRSDHVELKGVTCHIGSGGSDIEAYASAFRETLRVAAEFRSLGAPIECIDFGGGFAVSYSGHYQPIDLLKFTTVIESVASGVDYEFIVEPGKFLVAEAGIFLTRVVYRKKIRDTQFVIIDGGMNDLIRPAIYEAYHKIDLVTEGPGKEPGLEKVDVVGPVCEGGCFFARDREMAITREGDLVVVRDAGAYCFAMASSYNGRRLPAEVLVDKGNATLVRKRDTFEDLWRNEVF